MGDLDVRVTTPSIPLEFVVKKKTLGQQLLNKVAGFLGLREVRFFGLQFVDYKGTSTWLGPSEALSSQRARKESPLHFQLKVRFWPHDVPALVGEETALVLFFRQLQAAVDSGELCCPSSVAAQLAAYAAQIQYGDFTEDGEKTCYRESVVPPGAAGSDASRRGLSPEAQTAWQLKVACLHRNIRGLPQRDALTEYFKLAQELPTYGVTYFEVMTKQGVVLWLGVTARGVYVYEDKLTPKLSFSWSKMHSVCCSAKKITIKLENKDMRFVFHTRRRQVCVDIMMLIKGYHALQRRERRHNFVSNTYASDETLSFRTGRVSLDDADRNESNESSSASIATSSSASSRPTSSGDGDREVPVARNEAAASEENTAGDSEQDSDATAGRSEEGNAVVGSDEAAAARIDSESTSLDRAIAMAQDTFDEDHLHLHGDSEHDSEEEDSYHDLNAGAVGYSFSNDEGSDSDVFSLLRSNHFERSLSLSESENWGPFVQSLMAPD